MEKKLNKFPRIWIIALSKADLLPEVDVFDFRDLLILKASDEINVLRDVLSEFCEGREALSFGEDFVLLSSAKFEISRIQVDENLGLNLLLPITAALPLERQIRWKNREILAKDVLDDLTPLFVKAFGFIIEKKVNKRVGKLIRGKLPVIALGGFRKNINEDQRQIDLTADLLQTFFVTMQTSEDDTNRPIFMRSLR